MSEAFSITKLVKSPFTGLFWVKTIMFGLGMACLYFIGFGVYKAYFKKPEPSLIQNQQAESMINPSFQNQRVMFGCMNWALKSKEIKDVK